jgi:predicted GNAT family acetyltransferase
LIGHATLIEARTIRAMKEFALIAQSNSSVHMILGEEEDIQLFWSFYAEKGQEMRLSARELLFELKRAPENSEPVEGLRVATLEDLDLILPVQAELACAESGVNPLQIDSPGFRERCARRIQRKRVWVVIKDQCLIFKADIQAQTQDVIYLEGVYAGPTERGTGLAAKCLKHLAQTLLNRTRSICLLVNEERTGVRSFYEQANFNYRERFLSIFLHR